MKSFLLGVVSTLAVLALAAVAVLLSLGDGGDGGPGRHPRPRASSSRAPVAPDDLAADETWLGTVDLRSDDVVSAEGDLAGVVAKGAGSALLPHWSSAAQRLDVDATVPFADRRRAGGRGTRVYAAGNGLAGVERRVTILGRDLTVTATGTVKADGGQLLIEPETVDLGGPSFLDTAASAIARTLVTIRQPVAGVPDGMALTAVRVVDDGFAARLTGVRRHHRPVTRDSVRVRGPRAGRGRCRRGRAGPRRCRTAARRPDPAARSASTHRSPRAHAAAARSGVGRSTRSSWAASRGGSQKVIRVYPPGVRPSRAREVGA